MFIQVCFQCLESTHDDFLATKFINIDVQSNFTVELLKERIYDKTGISCDQQMLKFGNIIVEDGFELQHYKLQSRSILHLSLRKRNGNCVNPCPVSKQ